MPNNNIEAHQKASARLPTLESHDDNVGNTSISSSSMSRMMMEYNTYVYADNPYEKQVPSHACHVIVRAYCKSIGCRAFDGCIDLRDVSFEGGVICDDDDNNSLQIIHSLAFWGCTSLQTLMPIPSSVHRIDEAAFEKCTALREVFLPERLQHISDSTFYECTSLEFIAIPTMVRTIGKYAFAYCQALREIQFPPSSSSTPDDEDNNNVVGRLEVIGSSAFKKCTSLTKAVLPSTVCRIGKSAFEGCTQLEQVIMLDGGTSQTTTTRLMNIDLRAFQNCVQLSLMKLPKSLLTMDKTAFDNCTNLTQLELPPSFQLKSFQISWPLIKQVLVTCVPTYPAPHHQQLSNNKMLWNELKQVCARAKSSIRKQRVYALANKMRDCRRMEITSLLELALWKKAILSEVLVIRQQEKKKKKEANSHAGNDAQKMMLVDRTKCHITCGAHVVMQHVVEYLIIPHQPSSTTASCSIRPWNGSAF